MYHAGRLLTSGLLPVIFSLAIVGNLVMGRIFLGQAITGRLLAGAGIGIAGVAVMFSAEFARTEADAALFLGIALALSATLSSPSATRPRRCRHAPASACWWRRPGA